MKTLILLCALLLPTITAANPLLLCDPYPEEAHIQGFSGSINGTPFNTTYSLHTDGSAIIFDCKDLGQEAWRFTNVRAYNATGPSTPISFTFPLLPESLLGKRVHLE